MDYLIIAVIFYIIGRSENIFIRKLKEKKEEKIQNEFYGEIDIKDLEEKKEIGENDSKKKILFFEND